jgi:hypothetical protein
MAQELGLPFVHWGGIKVVCFDLRFSKTGDQFRFQRV